MLSDSHGDWYAGGTQGFEGVVEEQARPMLPSVKRPSALYQENPKDGPAGCQPCSSRESHASAFARSFSHACSTGPLPPREKSLMTRYRRNEVARWQRRLGRPNSPENRWHHLRRRQRHRMPVPVLQRCPEILRGCGGREPMGSIFGTTFAKRMQVSEIKAVKRKLGIANACSFELPHGHYLGPPWIYTRQPRIIPNNPSQFAERKICRLDGVPE
ncbi:hypothetical protein BCR34DRAFT_311635 [Clohesyomyces aquaticus]|uniref:Uncharacterized protein n=1 Tax=Clohesyomyces aquaticus TaxID=1231657 RepID=A0A1Y1XX09_9PLEO|nr:hypothetical protein BCR34DRAFT_311635 [Clohesyomyces aquaticus]